MHCLSYLLFLEGNTARMEPEVPDAAATRTTARGTTAFAPMTLCLSDF